MIQFSWPWAFLLLPAPLLYLAPSKAQLRSAVSVPPVLADALSQFANKRYVQVKPVLLLLWLAWLCLITAIAQPWYPGDTVIQPVSGRAIALAVDVSGSMERRDFMLDEQPSDRLSVVKRAAQSFIEQRHGDRLSLILFGRDAYIASPLTFDLASLSSILGTSGIGMAGRSTAIGDALGLAIKTLQQDPASHKAIVLLSDGTNNAGTVEPESAALLAERLGIRIHTIAMGSEDGQRSGFQTAQSADLDEQTLNDIAHSAGGRFFRARDASDLADVYATIDALESAEVDAPPVILREDLRVWPQLFCLFSLLLVSHLQWQRR